MPEKAIKPDNYGKDGYSPQTETAKAPVQPQKQGEQGGGQEKKK